MARTGASTNGNLYVETWVGDSTHDVSQVSKNNTNIKVFHVVEVTNGSTYQRNIRVSGNSPQGHLQFNHASNPSQIWNDTIKNLTKSIPDHVKCELKISATIPSGSNERLECSSLEYEDRWNPGVWHTCYRGMPLQVSVKVV